MNNTKEIFTDIFVNRKWAHSDYPDTPPSGPGSSLDYTQNLRAELPKLFEQFQIQTVFDAPCGDLTWMSDVLKSCPTVQYTGGDIVEPMIEQHKTTYPEYNFVTIDIIKDPLPAADIMICRDCLFHFPINDIKKFLKNFVKSDIASLLTTSHVMYSNTPDIELGGYRELNLFDTNFNFTRDYIYKIDDWVRPFPERKMYMWSHDQIAKIVEKF